MRWDRETIEILPYSEPGKLLIILIDKEQDCKFQSMHRIIKRTLRNKTIKTNGSSNDKIWRRRLGYEQIEQKNRESRDEVCLLHSKRSLQVTRIIHF